MKAGEFGDPPGHLVRHLRNRNAQRQPLVRRLRSRPELRISAWSAHNRARASARHLCGHKCLHKLVDDFMARTLSARAPSSAEAGTEARSSIAPCRLRTQASSRARPASHAQRLRSSARMLRNFESSRSAHQASLSTLPHRGQLPDPHPPRRSLETRTPAPTPIKSTPNPPAAPSPERTANSLTR